MKPIFFATPAEFRRWLERHAHTHTELWVGFYKKSTGRPSITWSESVDEALCFGWIDGIRKKVDEESYTNRFTPRRAGSNWSLVNIRKVRTLVRSGRMQPAGLRAFKARDPEKTRVYSFERKTAALSPEEAARFRKNRKAWSFFESQPPGYRKLAIVWVVTAKQQVTRARRLDTLIEDSSKGQRRL